MSKKGSKVSTVAKGAKATTPKSKKDLKGKVVKATVVEDITEKAVEEKKIPESFVALPLIDKAIEELQKFAERSADAESEGKSQLFEDEWAVQSQLIFSKKDLFSAKKNFKPKLITIEKKPKAEDALTIALFVRDGLIDKKLLEQIENSELNGLIGEIITGQDLKTTYKQYEKRRELLQKYDLFVSDDALITALPKLLGKVFYDSPKLPIAIKIGPKFSIPSITKHLQKITNSIVYHVPRSNNLTVNVGSIEDLTSDVVIQVINHFKNTTGLRSIFIKTNKSPALPLYEATVTYTEDDIKSSKDESVDDEDDEDLDVTEDNVKLTEFERGLIEIANPDDVSKLISSKVKKSKKAKLLLRNKKITNKSTINTDSKIKKPSTTKAKKISVKN